MMIITVSIARGQMVLKGFHNACIVRYGKFSLVDIIVSNSGHFRKYPNCGQSCHMTLYEAMFREAMQ